MIADRLLWLLVVAGLLLMTAGCARPLDVAVATSNAAAAGLRATHDQIARRYEADQRAAAKRVQGDRNDPSVRAEQHERVRLVRERYAPVWEAYALARLAWVGAVGAIEVAQAAVAAGGQLSLAEIFRLLDVLATVQRELFVAADRIGLSPPNAPPRSNPLETP